MVFFRIFHLQFLLCIMYIGKKKGSESYLLTIIFAGEWGLPIVLIDCGLVIR